MPRKRSTPRRSILVLALVASITLVGGPANVTAGAAVRPAEVGTSDGRAQVSYHRFVEPDGPITIGSGTVATWTSSDFAPGFAFTELVASWNADTPEGSLVDVELQATPDFLRWTKWYALGRWAYGDATYLRTSVGGQGDADGTVVIDTFVAGEVPMVAYRLSLTLLRRSEADPAPVVRALGAMSSAVPTTFAIPSIRARSGTAALPSVVPAFSQEIHAGHYPEFDGGGEAWCSPASTAMVLAYWGASPNAADLAYIPAGHGDPQVDHAARYTYDSHYRGTGNWPFNTAYAGRFGLDGFVTQLRSLTELERFIRAGIPVVTSQSFQAEELPGAGYSTNGHLMVIIGFTKTGDVIANDPASASNEAVRRVYPRAAFEKVWQRSTGGVVYIIHPKTRPLPRHVPGLTPNW